MGGGAAFYCVADSRHFLGVVALINSLRLLGHDETIFVADSGLEPGQRALLAPHAALVPAGEAPAPHLLKCMVPRARPADTTILVDADVILIRPLTPILLAAGERAVVFADAVPHRFHPEWSELLGVGPLRRQPYVNSGLLVLPRALATRILPRVVAGQTRVDVARSFVARGHAGDPFYYLDQDVWNAVLAACLSPDELLILDHRLAPHPPFAGLRLLDESELRCAYADGTEPYGLHHVGPRKPWLAATRWTVYSRLLRRLLLAPDLALRLEPDQVPLRLRPGSLAWVDRRRATLVALAASQRGRLGLRRRLAARRVQTAAGESSSGRPSSPAGIRTPSS